MASAGILEKPIPVRDYPGNRKLRRRFDQHRLGFGQHPSANPEYGTPGTIRKLNVQHQFGWNTLLDIGYVGKKGTHLYAMGYNEFPDTLSEQGAATCMTNTAACFAQVANPFYGVPAFAGSADLRRSYHTAMETLGVPYPQYSNGSASGITSSFVPWANSIYNGLQIKAEKRFSQGLQFLVSYTWQKSIDDSSLGIERLFIH